MSTFRVEGSNNVLGHEPGTKFNAKADDEQIARLVARGSLSEVTSGSPDDSTSDEGSGSDPQNEGDDTPDPNEGGS